MEALPDRFGELRAPGEPHEAHKIHHNKHGGWVMSVSHGDERLSPGSPTAVANS